MSNAPIQEFIVESFNTDPEGRPRQSDICTVSPIVPKLQQ